MDILYKVEGIRVIGDRICLTIRLVKEKEGFDSNSVLKNLGGFMDNMKLDAINSRNPDQISISKEEYKKGGFDLGKIISVSINGE